MDCEAIAVTDILTKLQCVLPKTGRWPWLGTGKLVLQWCLCYDLWFWLRSSMQEASWLSTSSVPAARYLWILWQMKPLFYLSPFTVETYAETGWEVRQSSSLSHAPQVVGSCKYRSTERMDMKPKWKGYRRTLAIRNSDLQLRWRWKYHSIAECESSSENLTGPI